MSAEPPAGRPRRVAVAIVRADPPKVLLATGADVLSRLLAVKVVASSDPSDFSFGDLEGIRQALLQERWGDAVAGWIDATGINVDGYPDEEIWSEDFLNEEVASMEIRLARIFDERPKR